MRLDPRWMALTSVLLAACECDGREAVRCADESPALVEPRQIGSVRVVPENHTLALEGLPNEASWVFARGPALSREPIPPMVDAIESLHPDAVMILGSVGSGARLTEFLAALGELAVPVFLLPGPRDARSELSAAIAAASARPSLLDAVGVQRVTWGTTELLLVPGAESGRYATPGACAFEEADLQSIIAGSDPTDFRLLVGFAAPAGTLQTQGLAEAEAGSALVRAQMEQGALEAGVFAWPSTRIGLPFGGGAQLAPGATSTQFRLIVGPIAGPALEGDDGGRPLGQPTLVRIGPQGAQLIFSPPD